MLPPILHGVFSADEEECRGHSIFLAEPEHGFFGLAHLLPLLEGCFLWKVP